MSVDDMNADFQIYQQTRELAGAIAEVHQLMQDTRLVAGAECWQAWLAYYGALCSIASRDGELATRIQPAVDFMATGPRKKNEK